MSTATFPSVLRRPIDPHPPVTVAEAIAAAPAQPLLHGVEDPAALVHPFDGMCKVCAQKDPPVQTPLAVRWRQLGPLATGWFAVNCCDACYAEAREDTERARNNRRYWATICPPEFRDEWDPMKGRLDTLEAARRWSPKYGRGLIIHGRSGTCKTRTVWYLLRELGEAGYSFMFCEAYDLADEIPEGARTTGILVIDDLGNHGLNTKGETRLLRLIKERAQWRRPMIVTTQSTESQLFERFSDTGAASAILRRLIESCDKVWARQYKDEVLMRSRRDGAD